MRTILTAVAIVAALAPHAAAQSVRRNPSAGVIGGLSVATLNFSEPSGTAPTDRFLRRRGGALGAVLLVPVSRRAALRIDPMYLQKGTVFDTFGQQSRLVLEYFEVPILAIVELTRGAARPYVVGGPSAGYLLKAKVKTGGSTEDVKDEFENADFGVTVGGGVTLSTARKTFFIEARYSAGLTNISKETDDSVNAKTRGVVVMGAIAWRLGR